jgi:hypothetical protein
LLNQPLENKGPLFQVDVDFVKKTDQCRKWNPRKDVQTLLFLFFA